MTELVSDLFPDDDGPRLRALIDGDPGSETASANGTQRGSFTDRVHNRQVNPLFGS